MFKAVIIGGFAASLLLPAGAASAAPDIPPPSAKVTVEVVTVNGSGCPAGTAAVAVAGDNTAFTVTYSDYLAQTGVGAALTDFRKNCQLSLRVNVPAGFTYAIAKADYRGFAHLESGATALERANYYFQGDSSTSYISHPFTGPLSDDWQTTDVTDAASLVFAPCGEQRNLNVNTELRVNAGTSDPTKTNSFITMDSTDGSVRTTYQFTWMQCP